MESLGNYSAELRTGVVTGVESVIVAPSSWLVHCVVRRWGWLRRGENVWVGDDGAWRLVMLEREVRGLKPGRYLRLEHSALSRSLHRLGWQRYERGE